jgi:hypothetical protein
VTLSISAPSLPSITTTIKVGAFPHTCISESAAFATAEGGCKDLMSGRVWSMLSFNSLSWHDAIWGYEAGGFNPLDPPDADDGPATNDYDPAALPPVEHRDNSTLNYCHQLVEGGYSDWRLPKSSELITLGNNLIGSTSMAFIINTSFWSSSSRSDTHHGATVNLFTRNWGWTAKGDKYSVTCVRDP